MRRNRRDRWPACGLLVGALVGGPGMPGPGEATPSTVAPAGACAKRLSTATVGEQLHCLGVLRRGGGDVSWAIPHLTALLVRSDGATDDRVIVGALDVLRSLGRRGAPAASTLSGLLAHRAPLYRDRDKMLVVRLRAYLLVTLGDIGVPDSARPALFDLLAHQDERMSAVEIGAAARAAGSLGASGHAFATYLIEAIPLQVSETEFSLERYEPDFPPSEGTTIQIEAVKSLGRVCSERDADAVAALRRLAAEERAITLDPRVMREARLALARIATAAGPSRASR
jgi:hypothetical protein